MDVGFEDNTIHRLDGSSGQMLKIELTKHGYLLFDSSAVSQFPGFSVEMTFGSDLPLKETMRKLVVSLVGILQQFLKNSAGN